MMTDSHETNMTPEVKAIANQRMKHYKIICFLGLALITWIDKALLLNRLNEYSNIAAHICTIYFTFALVCMLLGLTASSFPDSALCAKTVSSNGALQAFLLLNAVVHLGSIEFYPEVSQGSSIMDAHISLFLHLLGNVSFRGTPSVSKRLSLVVPEK